MTNLLYGELEDVMARLGIEDLGDDGALGSCHAAACRQIDHLCAGIGPFWKDSATVVRTFTPDDPRCLDLTADGTVPGIATTTSVVVKLDVDDSGTFETTLTTNTDYLLRPTNANVQVPPRPYRELYLTGTTYLFNRSAYGRDTVQVTAFWGWPSPPEEIVEAAIVQTIHLFKSGKDAQTGALFFAGGDAVGALRVSGLHPLARGLIAAYRAVAVG